MTTASSNDVVVCKYADIPDEDDEKCSTNIIVNDETPVKTENKGEKRYLLFNYVVSDWKRSKNFFKRPFNIAFNQFKIFALSQLFNFDFSQLCPMHIVHLISKILLANKN